MASIISCLLTFFNDQAQPLIFVALGRDWFFIHSYVSCNGLYVQFSTPFSKDSTIAKPPETVVVNKTLCSSADLLIENESLMDCLPSVVLIIISISLFRIASTICGLPSNTLLINFTLILVSFNASAVLCGYNGKAKFLKLAAEGRKIFLIIIFDTNKNTTT